MSKVVIGLVVAALIAPIVAAKLMYEATAHTGTGPENQPWVQHSMEFVTWNGEKWTAWVRDDTFEQRPQNEGQWHPHANASLAFIDWENKTWQVKIDGDAFLLAHKGDWQGATERVNAIRYRDWEGENQLRTLTQLKR